MLRPLLRKRETTQHTRTSIHAMLIVFLLGDNWVRDHRKRDFADDVSIRESLSHPCRVVTQTG